MAHTWPSCMRPFAPPSQPWRIHTSQCMRRPRTVATDVLRPPPAHRQGKRRKGRVYSPLPGEGWLGQPPGRWAMVKLERIRRHQRRRTKETLQFDRRSRQHALQSEVFATDEGQRTTEPFKNLHVAGAWRRALRLRDKIFFRRSRSRGKSTSAQSSSSEHERPSRNRFRSVSLKATAVPQRTPLKMPRNIGGFSGRRRAMR